MTILSVGLCIGPIEPYSNPVARAFGKGRAEKHIDAPKILYHNIIATTIGEAISAGSCTIRFNSVLSTTRDCARLPIGPPCPTLPLMASSHVTYRTLFDPLSVRDKLIIPNRLVMAPMTTTSGELDGRFSEQEITYLIRRAEAGVGLVVSPACYCHKSGHAFERQVGCHSDCMLPPMKRLTDGIRRHNAVSFLQIHHGGNAARAAFTGQPPWAPSAVHNRRGTSELPHAMTEAEIWEVIEAFGRAGRPRQARGIRWCRAARRKHLSLPAVLLAVYQRAR